MAKGRRERRVLAAAGAAALVAVGINLLISAINARKEKKKKKRDLPGLLVRVDLTASEIHKLTDEIIYKSKEVLDLVASVPLEKVTYENVILPLAELEAYQFPLIQSCVFPRMVSTSSDVCQASAEAEKRLDLHLSVCSAFPLGVLCKVTRKREDVYRVVKALVVRGESLSTEAKRYIQCLVKEFEHNGANLSLSKRQELDNLRKQIDELSLQFIQNLRSDNSFVLLNETDLAGMPSQFVKSLEKADNGIFKVYLKSYHVTPILEHCKVQATRKLIGVAYGKRCGKENLDILEKLVQVRHKFARLLGYSSYGDFATQCRMPKTSAKVLEFLEGISITLNDLASAELNLLTDLKRMEEGDSAFGMEDLLYYIKRAEEEQVHVDLGELKQYFPVNLVLSGIFKIFQDLFGLKFEEVKDIQVWHESVSIFSVVDLSSCELFGYFYLDIFSREGKYAHTCVLPLQNGSLSSDGTRQIPAALLVSQCPKQIDDNPVLLRFPEVVSLFHEFSHVVHHICNSAKFSRFSGLSLEADFKEIPGHLLENWCYETTTLKMISGFHQDITKCMTDEMCESLRRRRDLFSGLKLKQEVLVCLVDQILHSSEDVDIVELLKHLHPQVMLGLPLLEGTNAASCFPLVAIGYEAVCYSHVWSKAIAADIFRSKFQHDLLNQYEGLQFRDKILAPGGSKEPHELISYYLGREPSVQPFIQSKIVNGS